MIPRIRVGLGAFALAAALVSVSACSGSDGDDKSDAASDTPIPAAPAGPEIADLQARWFTWAASQPATASPLADASGQQCAQGQPDDVWFVAGSVGGTAVKRTCTVPTGRSIAGPLLAIAPADAAVCADFIASADGEVVLDGSPVDVRKTDPEPITITGVPGNPITQNAADTPAQACGLWFTIPSPTPGAHKLTITGVSGETRVDVEYTLNVSA